MNNILEKFSNHIEEWIDNEVDFISNDNSLWWSVDDYSISAEDLFEQISSELTEEEIELFEEEDETKEISSFLQEKFEEKIVDSATDKVSRELERYKTVVLTLDNASSNPYLFSSQFKIYSNDLIEDEEKAVEILKEFNNIPIDCHLYIYLILTKENYKDEISEDLQTAVAVLREDYTRLV